MFNYQPLEQFEVTFLGTFKNIIPITNSLIYLIFIYVIIRGSLNLFFKDLTLVPSNNWQVATESLYEFAFSLVKQQIGKKGYAYFPIVFSLFIFILIANLLGMTLYSFTVTSHVTVAFTLSFSFFIAVVIIGVIKQGKDFVETFIPSGAPKALLPFLIVIEFISYISRPFSLGIRLFANMMSGHALLFILSSFTLSISKKNIIIAAIPFVLITAIVGLEAMIAVLQAYVFTVLVCIYLSDSIHGAH